MAHINPNEIKEILDTLQIPAAEFARKTYVSRSYVSHLQSGRKSNPSKLWASQVMHFCRQSRLKAMADKIEKRLRA